MKQLSLKVKLFTIVFAVIILLALILTLRSYQGISQLSNQLSEMSEKNITESVVARLQAETQAYGEQVNRHVSTSFQVALTLRDLIENSAATNNLLERSQLNQIVASTLDNNPEISAVYAQFEPNGYDGLDNEYLGRGFMHSPMQGSLEIYWIRDIDGSIIQIEEDDPNSKYDTTANEFGVRESEWYLCPREQQAPCILEPHMYEISETYSELMTSLVVPIFIRNRFQGVTGIDINLPEFQSLMERLSKSLYDGVAKVTLLSENGLIVAASHYQDSLTRPMTEANTSMGKQLADLSKTAQGYFLSDTHLFLAQPIDITDAKTQWSIVIEMPLHVAMAELIAQQEAASSQKRSILISQIIIAIILAVAAFFLMSVVIQSIIRPLNELNKQVDQLASADGDLSHQLNLDTHAELITLGGSFNLFIYKLRDLVNALKDISVHVRGDANENLNISHQTSSSTYTQQQEIDSVVTATQEMSATAHEVARIAAEVSHGAEEIQSFVRESQTTLQQAVETTLELSDNMSTASNAISQVSTRSENINSILDVIRAIAEQTNLLALNAAIEAARAGEQGRGFAVVADEVRTLASRTQTSTEEINTMILGLQDEVQQAVQVIEVSNNQAISTMESTRSANESLTHVVHSIATIADNIRQVATAAEEQSSVSEDITKNLTVIGDAAQVLADLAAQANSGSQSVNHQLDLLDDQLKALRTS